jgi:hypothetical protein
MTDKSDKEKIEAAALSWKQQPDGSVGYCVDCFKAGVAWRDKNPGPHVMDLKNASNSLGNAVVMGSRNEITMGLKNLAKAIAEFEKAVKGE